MGGFAAKRCRKVLSQPYPDLIIEQMLHPSPISPRTNHGGWSIACMELLQKYQLEQFFTTTTQSTSTSESAYSSTGSDSHSPRDQVKALNELQQTVNLEEKDHPSESNTHVNAHVPQPGSEHVSHVEINSSSSRITSKYFTETSESTSKSASRHDVHVDHSEGEISPDSSSSLNNNLKRKAIDKDLNSHGGRISRAKHAKH